MSDDFDALDTSSGAYDLPWGEMSGGTFTLSDAGRDGLSRVAATGGSLNRPAPSIGGSSRPGAFYRHNLGGLSGFGDRVGSVHLEGSVRPFTTVEIALRAEPPPRALLPGEGTTAFISWGERSNFTTPTFDEPIANPGSTGGTTTQIREMPRRPPEKEPDDAVTILTYEEVSRTEKEVRVENPDDEEQYVILKRIETITFVGSDGKYRKFVFQHPDD